MGSQNKRRRKGKVDRRQAAMNSQLRLVELIVGRKEHDSVIVQSSIRHLVRISRRHRLPVPESVRHLYCKNVESRSFTVKMYAHEFPAGNALSLAYHVQTFVVLAVVPNSTESNRIAEMVLSHTSSTRCPTGE